MKTIAAAAFIAVVGFAGAAFAQVSAAQVAGTYVYNGTDTDGSPYEKPGTVVVKQVPSGAIEVVWDGGQYLGVGQLIGNTLAVASVAEGKNTIMALTVGADGTISGPWWRRTDNGSKGTEVWKKK